MREGPIARWDEGLPLGNGLLGALVWGEDNVVRISLDRGDLWDTRVPGTLESADWTYAEMVRLKRAGEGAGDGSGGTAHARHRALFDEPYDTIPYPTKLPGGRLELRFEPGVRVEGFSLNLEGGVATVRHSAGTVTVMIWHGSLGDTGTAWFEGPLPEVSIVRPAGLDRLGYGPAEETAEGLTRTLLQRAAGGTAYCVAAGWGGPASHKRLDFTIQRSEAGEATDAARSRALAAIARTVHSAKPAATDDDEALSLTAGTLVHALATKEAWRASGVRVPDGRIQAQYDLARYLYAAGSRRGAPPIPLQGLWTADEGGLPPWKGDYHHDLNTQMTYLAYHDAGLREEGLSFVEQLRDLRPRFERFAREFYGLEARAGRYAPLVVPGVMGLDGAPLGGWGQYSLSPTHTAWLAQTFDLHWRYTGDEAFLAASAYPWCAGAGEALLGLMREEPGPGGRAVLRLPVSSSPEIHDNTYAAWLEPNSNYDQSLLRYLFGTLTEMAGALGRSEDAARWRGVLARLEPLERDPRTGALLVARGEPLRASHRHFSHAMAIYPLGTVHIEGSEEDRRTVEATIDQLEALGTRAWVGYSFAWMSAMCARAGQGERALGYLEKYLSFTGPNGFHLNGDQSRSGLSAFTYRPFTLEGNFLAMQAVHEMLVQSWPSGREGEGCAGTVWVFPAVSARWGEASFRELCARGGLRVSAERRGGRTIRVELRAERAGVFRLRDPFEGRGGQWSIGARAQRDGRDWAIRLERGERAVLEAGE